MLSLLLIITFVFTRIVEYRKLNFFKIYVFKLDIVLTINKYSISIGLSLKFVYFFYQFHLLFFFFFFFTFTLSP